jgi:hypothetical protein
MNDIEKFCKKYLKNYTINPDNTIDVNGDVYLPKKLGKMTKLPVKFGKVYGEFWCSNNKLTTLEGCPNYVGGYFYCSHNKLTSLEGCPNYVGGYFNCIGNEITTLEGCPNYVGRFFDCGYCDLTTLKGIEKCEIIGNFYCYNDNIPPEKYIYILTAKIGGKIETGINDNINDIDNIIDIDNINDIDKILNTYKNEVKYLHKALSELKKVKI